MTGKPQVPETSVTVPGYFHLLPVVGKLILGRLNTGQTAVLSTSSLAELDRLESAIQVLRTQLSMWHADHPERVA